MANKSVQLNIKRQNTPESQPYWEEFELQWRAGMNVIIALMDIASNPVNRQGKPIAPIVYDSNCLEEACGPCAMLINGQAAIACSSLIDKLDQQIPLEPLSRFPVIRDLSVDRSILFENLMRVYEWVPIDGTYPLGSDPRIDPAIQELAYPLSRCMSCCYAWKYAHNSTSQRTSLGPQSSTRYNSSTCILRVLICGISGSRQ